MFRRQTKTVFNSHRWFSHRSGSRKSSYALTRGAALATSVAAVAAATIASQKFIGGSIHNDTAATAVPSNGNLGTTVAARVRTGCDDDEGLKLLVWGSNRSVRRFSTTFAALFLPPSLSIL
jgi:hypothetical protein